MAETLEVLIKLAERKVEAAQRELAAVVRRLETNRAAQERWQADLAVAHAAALTDATGLGLKQASLFSRRVARELEVLRMAAAEMEGEADTVRARLAGHYAEQKRYEVLLEQKRARERKRRFKKAQAALDESAQYKPR